ncbi:sugar phosphate nucleotidyltransferase [Mycoplasmopsis hyopharyngis]|uniref:sugar phosphate nucleotidyltransferase n=1 Tax=Mycoplasmopsis hyopharyngis TaxID=29558 RepID=UPI003872FAB4
MIRNEKRIEKNAIILAAGFGSRLVPLTFDNPKGLIKIKNNESMIERQIVFLHSVGITDITIVVGYMSEAFEEIKNKYKLNIIYNKEFNISNSMYSLFLAKDKLKNTYILNSDAWIEKNFFNDKDEHPYLTVIKNQSDSAEVYEWRTKLDKDNNIINLKPSYLNKNEFYITGPAYFDEQFSNKYLAVLNEYIKNDEFKQNSYWEECLFELIKNNKIKANDQSNNVFEIDNLENIYEIDKERKILYSNRCLTEIAKLFNVKIDDINEIQTIKKGLTNNSFSFVVNNTKFVYRSAGKGTENIIDRKREQKVYSLIKNFRFAEKLYFYNPITFSKISYFAIDHKNVDQYNETEVLSSFKMIREFHDQKYVLGQEFNIEQEINKYLKGITKSKKNVEKESELTHNIFVILNHLKALNIPKTLCHIDFIPDNILIDKEQNTVLIDYEYAGDADPLIDIAAFATSAFYDKKWLDKTIGYYFLNQKPTKEQLIRIYGYMAILGYLWWLWTYVYMDKGDDIGQDYLKHMLNNAKIYTKILKESDYGIF